MVVNWSSSKWLVSRKKTFISVLIIAMLLLISAGTGLAVEGDIVQHYRVISTVEYTGQGQFRNQVETSTVVRKQLLSDETCQYSVSMDGVLDNLSFVIDNKKQFMSVNNSDMALLGKVSNECVKSLKKVTTENIGKTWKQSMELSSVSNLLPSKLRFTLTAIKLDKGMIAVRALSEPFFIKTAEGSVMSKVNSVCLFDSQIEDIYLSISVFEAATNMNGFREILRNEVTAYKTDSKNIPTDLSGLGSDFEKLVGKVGLSASELKIDKQASLPGWAKEEGLQVAQVANVCSAIVCEGALNPVSSVSLPMAQIIGAQKNASSQKATKKTIAKSTKNPNIFHQIRKNWGWNLPTAGVVGGVTAGGIAAGGGFGGGGGGSSAVATE